jgi:hypothetical protein
MNGNQLDFENQSVAGLLNKSSCFAGALGVIKFYKNTRYNFGHTLFCYFSLTWMFNKSTSGPYSFSLEWYCQCGPL